MSKPILLSGIQPTGRLHIGNYLGALKNWVLLQKTGRYQCYFLIVDLHALTESPEPEELHENILNLAADYLAAGIDPKKSVVALQSAIPAHSELAWILGTATPFGELNRMTQFKEKIGLLEDDKRIQDELDALEKTVNDKMFMSKIEEEAKKMEVPIRPSYLLKQKIGAIIKDVRGRHLKTANKALEDTNVGLFTYPVLMAADIILYNTAFVPVGDDQLQHLELTRTLVRKFNARFPARRSLGEGGGETFIEPKPLLTEVPRVMSLGNPARKMSKSEPNGCLFLDDSPSDIETKIKRAVTDSGSEVKFDEENKPALANLLRIYSSLSDETISRVEKQFSGKTYSEFKSKLITLTTNHFSSFRAKKKKLITKPNQLKKFLTAGSKKAAKVAGKKIAEVKKKIGISIT
ncbi:MAG: tryptophan--tRNA ligase [Patescibacteria group bacterium]|nr:tryptophan--tRNA ligase [Patescibacteria group bacterium]